MKILIRILFVLLALVVSSAEAQDSPKSIVGGIRAICISMVDDDTNADIAGGLQNNRQVATEICDCAEARMADDPVVKRVARLSKEERKSMPKRDQFWTYLTIKSYSASLACYADAVGKHADEVLAR